MVNGTEGWEWKVAQFCRREDRKGTLAVAVPLQSCLPGPFSEDCWLGGGRDRVSGEEYTDDGSLLCVGLRDSHLDNSY